MRRKKTTDQYADEKRWDFSFDLKEGSEDECQRERERVPDRSDELKGPPARPRNTEYPSVGG